MYWLFRTGSSTRSQHTLFAVKLKTTFWVVFLLYPLVFNMRRSRRLAGVSHRRCMKVFFFATDLINSTLHKLQATPRRVLRAPGSRVGRCKQRLSCRTIWPPRRLRCSSQSHLTHCLSQQRLLQQCSPPALRSPCPSQRQLVSRLAMFQLIKHINITFK